MNPKKLIQGGLGATAVGLFLLVLLLPLLAGRGTVQARGAGEGTAAVYLPLILRMLSTMTTPTTVPTSTATVTNTPSSTNTSTPTFTPTTTDTPTATITPTFTPTGTISPTPTNTPTPTYTPTPTATNTFTITRVSVASDGTQGNGTSNYPSISADGRYIAFDSVASNLVSNDINGHKDVFVYDLQTGQTSRVSVASDGTQGNSYAAYPSISTDGRYVTFVSDSSNLVIGDTNGAPDIFVHDRQTGQTSRVSVASDGTQANGFSLFSSISADGRYIVFNSEATNLVSGDTNGYWDIFVHDRQTGQTSRVSVASDGTQGNGNTSYQTYISADGLYVVFSSEATNLVSGDTNNEMDVFVHDRQTGQTSRVSIASDGTQANMLAGADSISGDGRYVVFSSMASNLVSGDTNGDVDVFVHDQQTGETSRVSIASDGTQGNGDSSDAFISADGRFVVFYSHANNLINGDTNNDFDVFVYDRQTGHTVRASIAFNGAEANGGSGAASISTDGRPLILTSNS